MLFDLAFSQYLKPTSPKYLVKMSGYLQTLNQEVLYNQHRYQNSPGIETPGVMMLEYLLNTLPIQEMVDTPDQFKRYSTYLEPDLSHLGRAIDTIQTHDVNTTSFLDVSARGCKEYIVPVLCDNPLSDMPVGLDWNAWKRMRPFRVAVMQSKELTFHSYQDVLKFRHDQPPLAIFTVNIPMLAMMYSVYLNTLNPVPEMTLPDFLHRYVVFPALLEDSVNLWVRDQYMECLMRTITTRSSHQDIAWVTANNGRIGSQYPQFVEDVYNLITLGQNMSTPPNTVLSSMLLLHGTSVLDYYADFRRLNQVPQLRQYRWMDYLLQDRWLDLIIRVVCLNKHWSQFSRFVPYLKREIALFNESHPWTDCPDAYTKAYITDSLSDKLALLETNNGLSPQ